LVEQVLNCLCISDTLKLFHAVLARDDKPWRDCGGSHCLELEHRQHVIEPLDLVLHRVLFLSQVVRIEDRQSGSAGCEEPTAAIDFFEARHLSPPRNLTVLYWRMS
jgi:hypothetical protein